MDSTINAAELAKLPLAKLAPTYRLQDGSGNGCFLDPPGYPTYYTRSVYTRFGNSPRRGATEVLSLHVTRRDDDWKPGETWDTRHAKYDALMRRLYRPLPIDHPRVRAWIRACYQHWHNCYQRRETDRKSYGSNVVIRGMDFHPHEEFDGDTFTWTGERPDDEHYAVVYIRKWYPDYQPEPDLIANPGRSYGDWWTTMEERPIPENCPGETRWGGRKPRHPVNGSWCQVCGWHVEDEAAAS